MLVVPNPVCRAWKSKISSLTTLITFYFPCSAQRVKDSVKESLQRLQTDYLDIVQVHDMEFGDLDQASVVLLGGWVSIVQVRCLSRVTNYLNCCPQILHETLPALSQLRKEGLVRCIGITGLPLGCFQYILDRYALYKECRKISGNEYLSFLRAWHLPGVHLGLWMLSCPTATSPSMTIASSGRMISVSFFLGTLLLLACTSSILSDSLKTHNNRLIPYLEKKGVGIINASVLSMGLLTPQGPPSWHPAPPALKMAAREAIGAAKARNVSLPTIAIAETVRDPRVACHLIGASSRQQVEEAVGAAILSLDPGKPLPPGYRETMDEVERILEPVKNITWPSGADH